MKRFVYRWFVFINALCLATFCTGQVSGNLLSSIDRPGALKAPSSDTSKFIYDPGKIAKSDTAPEIQLHEVDIVYFKTQKEWNEYYIYRERILKVMPYVKIAKELYTELSDKQENSKRREYRHYRHDLEKEMRGKFENELKDLTTGEGEMLFKLINRETHDNCYTIIKDLKGPMVAWFYQLVGKHWGYNLKDNYDPQKEKMIELIIRQLGASYRV